MKNILMGKTNRYIKSAIFAGALSAGMSTTAGAAFIVNTGDGLSTGLGQALMGDGQYLAAEFNIINDTTIMSVEGWMLADGPAEVGTIAIYADGGEIPDTNNELFSTDFTGNGFSVGWTGTSGLSWDIAAGTYWISFETRSGQNMGATMPGSTPNPLLNEAFRNSSGNWNENDGLDIGVRISAVPVPAAVWLFGSGLLGLIGIARRKNTLLKH